MEPGDTTRRLAAILAADVAGYTRLMGADEEATIAAWWAARRDVIDPRIADHHGRIVKHTGDGFLAEFGTVLDAVQCAVAIQTELADRNADVAADRRMDFRIGVNLGDIVVDAEDIYGDEVNIAARIESLAEPGGICVSGNVYNQVHKRIDFTFEDLGKQTVKNVSEPIRVYRVTLARSPTVDAPPPLPDKPSIAVLPFTEMSGDPDQTYFADGIVEDIITELSKHSWLLVIARNTTFTFKGASVDIKEAGRQLGVRYVMEGSIRKAGNRVRITAHLDDAQSGAHVWAERYDRELADVFAVQDEITQNVVGAIQPRLISAEAERAWGKPPESMAAWDYAVRGRWHVLRLTKEDNAKAQRLLREGLEHYPDNVQVLAFLSYSLIAGVIFGWSTDPLAWLTEARELAVRAANLDENDGLGPVRARTRSVHGKAPGQGDRPVQ